MSRMLRRKFLKTASAAGAAAVAGSYAGSAACSSLLDAAAQVRKPNIILILGDDLGLTDVACYGGKLIRTPNIDRLAAEGMRFTQSYSGSPVCAPSRCVLLTGLHTGHAYIRDNREIKPEGQEPIPADTVTLAKLLKQEGYATAITGKWGLGYPGSPGEPNKQGFDLFFGNNCQRHAHNYYPSYLWRNQERITLEGNSDSLTGRHYAPDLCEAEAMNFIRGHKDGPFFLFYATTVPHLALQVPEDSLAEYKGRWEEKPYDGKNGYLPHATPRAAYAAMVTRFDRSVGRLMALLGELAIENDTLVIFSSDNGSTYNVGGFDMDFFQGTGGLRMHKGYVYEGGIRIPLIGRWPSRIAAGGINNHVCAFQDLLPTFLDAAGAAGRIPAGMDGISFWPALSARGTQRSHSHLYMEFPAYGGQQMVRMGNWKGLRQNLAKNPAAAVELYDLEKDRAEKNDVAAAHPDVVRKIAGIMKAEHGPSAAFPFPALDRA